MPLYATRDDCVAYTAGLVVDDEDGMDRLIERAEVDIDSTVGDWPLLETTMRKFDPDELTTTQREQLMRATCAQVEFRITMGDEYFRQAHYTKVWGPDFRAEGERPIIAPKAVRELAGSGLLRTWRTCRPDLPPAA